MGLIDKIKGKLVSSDGSFVPPEASFATRPDIVYAPVSGVIIPLEEVNDEVISAGQVLMTFDVDAIKAAGCDEVIACVVSNPDAFKKVRHVGASGTLIGDRPLVKIGDPLLVVKK